MHEHPPQDSGGYGRRLKKKESTKGFTLVELIVVIVILAILAAILIPGLLKWIDQAKDKKYELEAREIALAAEAALAKVYAEGQVLNDTGYTFGWDDTLIGFPYGDPPLIGWDAYNNFMLLSAFRNEMEKLTDFNAPSVGDANPDGANTIFAIVFYGDGIQGQGADIWGGNIRGIEIYYTSDEVPICARLAPNSDSWEIYKDAKESGHWTTDWINGAF